MRKKLTLWIFLLPSVLFAQTQFKDGTLTIDFGKKNKQQQDTVKKEQQTYPGDEERDEDSPKTKKQKQNKSNVAQQEDEPDFKRDGLFKGLFIAGFNAAQVDGDEAWGYNHFGFTGGVGAMVRFHKNVSVSMELLYSMRGATKRFKINTNQLTAFNIDWDYVEVPIGINVHDKKLIMASVGLSVGALVRNKLKYNTYYSNGAPSDTLAPLCMLNEPRKIDLSVYAGFQFLIKQHFGIGLKFSYSLIGLRTACPNTRVALQYNNVLALRFMYIMDKSSFRKKK